MGKKITLSFKDTKRDNALYNYLMELDDKSHDIKFVLYQYFIAGNQNTPVGLGVPAPQPQTQSQASVKDISIPKKEEADIFNELDDIDLDTFEIK